MKIINALQGTVALHASPDEAFPTKGLNHQELIKLISDTYSFATKPQVLGISQPLIFQGGLFLVKDDKLPIYQLAILPNGDMVTAANTDIADQIMNDYTALLDSRLGYRFAAIKNPRRTYQSNIVVELDAALGEKIEPFKKIESLLQREINRPGVPFTFRRIAFGAAPAQTLNILLNMETIEKSDFVIDRREGEPNSDNRYFCAGPVRTSELIRIMELFEKELLR